MAYIMCPIVERLSLSPTAYSQIVCTADVNAQMHDHCQSTCRFLSSVFSVFFRWTRPSNVYCRQSSCLDLDTVRVVVPQLTSDPVSTTHQISIWSPPTLHVRCIIVSGRSFCLQAHTTHVMPAEPSAMLSTR